MWYLLWCLLKQVDYSLLFSMKIFSKMFENVRMASKSGNPRSRNCSECKSCSKGKKLFEGEKLLEIKIAK